MTEIDTPVEHISFVAGHRFLVLVIGAIIISVILVAISLELYNTSGAAQLDLSRPGYRSVSSQAAAADNTFQAYPSNGNVDKKSIEQFEAILNKQVDRIRSINAYGGDPLSPDALEISAPGTPVSN